MPKRRSKGVKMTLGFGPKKLPGGGTMPEFDPRKPMPEAEEPPRWIRSLIEAIEEAKRDGRFPSR